MSNPIVNNVVPSFSHYKNIEEFTTANLQEFEKKLDGLVLQSYPDIKNVFKNAFDAHKNQPNTLKLCPSHQGVAFASENPSTNSILNFECRLTNMNSRTSAVSCKGSISGNTWQKDSYAFLRKRISGQKEIYEIHSFFNNQDVSEFNQAVRTHLQVIANKTLINETTSTPSLNKASSTFSANTTTPISFINETFSTFSANAITPMPHVLAFTSENAATKSSLNFECRLGTKNNTNTIFAQSKASISDKIWEQQIPTQQMKWSYTKSAKVMYTLPTAFFKAEEFNTTMQTHLDAVENAPQVDQVTSAHSDIASKALIAATATLLLYGVYKTVVVLAKRWKKQPEVQQAPAQPNPAATFNAVKLT